MYLLSLTASGLPRRRTRAFCPASLDAPYWRYAGEQSAPVRLRALSLDDMARAQEVFVCSSIREILPVVSIDGRRVGGGTPGELTRSLLLQFRNKVNNIMGLTSGSGTAG